MKNIRIIPRLDIKGPNLVKGIHMEGLRVLGNPIEVAKTYYEQGADEIFFQDVVASLYGRNSLTAFIKEIASEIFIPLTVGGGIRTLEDIHDILRNGADKVAINTAAVKDPDLIRKAANKFGSSTIVVSIEVIKQSDGKYLIFTDNGRESTGIEAIFWAKKMEQQGAGELIITSVDQEGTGTGHDCLLTRMISECVSIPVIAHGGAGRWEHVKDVIIDGKADAVAIASLLHYDPPMLTLATQSIRRSEGNVEFLKNNLSLLNLKTLSLPSLKEHLFHSKINCRIEKILPL